MYDFVSKTNTFIAELQSRFSENISNELRASYVRVRDERQPGDPFPMIEISNVGDGRGDLAPPVTARGRTSPLGDDLFR